MISAKKKVAQKKAQAGKSGAGKDKRADANALRAGVKKSNE